MGDSANGLLMDSPSRGNELPILCTKETSTGPPAIFLLSCVGTASAVWSRRNVGQVLCRIPPAESHRQERDMKPRNVAMFVVMFLAATSVSVSQIKIVPLLEMICQSANIT